MRDSISTLAPRGIAEVHSASKDLQATKLTYAGVFLIALATLMHEILLTRIFSVTMWYHFAFMAISLVMFGMTAGGLSVYLHRNDYVGVRCKHQMALSSLWFAVGAVVSTLTHLNVPFIPSPSLAGAWSLALTYALMSLPFFFSGICVCAALTKFPRQVSRLYAADLVGAAIGCLMVICTLKVTDGPTAVFLVALLGSVGAALFAADGGFTKLLRGAVILSVLFLAFFIINTILVRRQTSFLRLMWAKGGVEMRPLYEEWNSFSRIAVQGDPSAATSPITVGISSAYHEERKVKQLALTIDKDAETTLTDFGGDLNRLDYLKYDVKNIVHYIRPNSDVLIIGAGGGRDVLSALIFGQKSVRAVEINQNIIHTVNQRFGDFTGHLDRNPKVIFVGDEARSYLARTGDRFDIVEASFIDTWAATGAGAFTLTENSLYTVEAWKLFLDRLSARGVLSFSRWYFPELPGEAYRLVSLASAALREQGIADPRQHIVLVRNLRRDEQQPMPVGAATILVSKAPFSTQDLDRIKEVAGTMQFDIVLSPRFALDSTFSALASEKGLGSLAAKLPLDFSPSTDDRPFFFNFVSFRNAFDSRLWSRGGTPSFNLQAVFVLGVLLVVVIALTLLCIIVPLLQTAQKETFRGAVPHCIYFAAIGFGFMLIEISQMQRLIIFLGHPTYALLVVLFVLLLASGLGSYSTQRTSSPVWTSSAMVRLLLLLGALLVFGVLTPRAITAFQASGTVLRIVVASGILFPLGLFMGMAFPLGLKLASSRLDSLTPWLWGINGATSICASVLAVAIAMNAGISRSFWAGFCCYAFACAAFLWAAFPGTELSGKNREQKLAER